LQTPITCKNVDETTNKNGKIMHCTYQRVEAGGQNWFTKFLLTELDGEDILIGFPWLKKVNPIINWKDKKLPNSKPTI
ncbi:hypothetical protein SERLA73DRAFT_42616, partial [Serpula lacrymans var. lacrymans S7.3]